MSKFLHALSVLPKNMIDFDEASLTSSGFDEIDVDVVWFDFEDKFDVLLEDNEESDDCVRCCGCLKFKLTF